MIAPEEHHEPARALAPERALASAVISQLIHDLCSSRPHLRHDAQRAIELRGLDLWIQTAGLDIEETTRRLLTARRPKQSRHWRPYRAVS